MSEKSKKEWAREEYWKGDGLRRQEKWEAAFHSFTRVIELDAEFELAWYCRGLCYHQNGEYDRAIADKTEAIRLNPKEATYFEQRGVSYFEKGEHDRAIADMTEAIRLDPNRAKSFRSRGVTYSRKGLYDRAIVEHTEAIRLNPKDALNFRERGISYHWKGEYDLAIADCTEAIRLNPGDDVAFTIRGCAHAATKKYSLAEDDFSSSIPVGAGDGVYYARRGLMRQFQGKTVEAMADCATGLKLSPKSSNVCCLQVVAFWHHGKVEQVEKELIRGFALQPSFDWFGNMMKQIPPIVPILRAMLRELSPSKMKSALEAKIEEVAGPGVAEPTLPSWPSSFRVLPEASAKEVRRFAPPAAAAADPLMDFLKELHLGQYYDAFVDAGVTFHRLPAFLLPNGDELLQAVIPGDMLGPKLARLQFVAKLKELQSSPRLSPPETTHLGELDRRNVKVFRDQVLGRGGFGVVYLGRLIQEAVDVAVKQIPLLDPSLIKKEVETMTHLKNENVLRVYGWWSDDKMACIVTELCANGSLVKFVGRGRVGSASDLRILLSYLASICSGMVYTHGRRVVHYDLKPSNVLLTSEDVVKICDFGVSRRALTATPGSLRGTPRFMPKPDPPRTPFECDVYAFSITAYEVLSGKQAFRDLVDRYEGMHLVTAIHKQGKFPNLDDDLPGVSSSVKKAIRRCWSSDPTEWLSFAQLLRVFRDAALGTKSLAVGKSGSSLIIEGC